LDKVIAIFKIARLERYALSFISELLSEASSKGRLACTLNPGNRN
jgi:hypothetical protein